MPGSESILFMTWGYMVNNGGNVKNTRTTHHIKANVYGTNY